MKLKFDDKGVPVVQDGNPVYVHDDGKEIPFDAAKTVGNLAALRTEARDHRIAKEAAEEKLKAFSDLDPAKAREALETVGKLDAKKLIDAGQVDTVRAEVNKAWETKFSDVENSRKTLQEKLDNLLVGGAFAGSKFIAEKLWAQGPAGVEVARSLFGKNCKVVDGKLKVFDVAGNPIYSRKTPGSEADFDEAIELLVDAYPFKDSILKADNGSGSGARHDGSGHRSTQKQMSRAEFDTKNPAEKQKFIREGGEVIDKAA